MIGLLLRYGLEMIAVTIVARWSLMRMRRVLLLPTNETTEPIRSNQVRRIRRIIVSDLHLGAGDRADDFDADENFNEFIVQYVLNGEPTELILAGDTFEFLQVRLPSIGDYDFSSWASQQRFSAILAAHAPVISALRRFLTQSGNQLTLLIGNHDFELHYSGVKNLLRRALGLAENDSRLRYGLTYEGEGVYLEHGNQFDSWNTFVNFGGISQPFEIVRGTRVVKDVINPLEEDPLDVATLIDNVKPTSAFLWYMLSLPRLRSQESRRYVTRGLLRMFRTVALPTLYSTRNVLVVREELLGAPGETLQSEIALQMMYELEPNLRAAAAVNYGGQAPELKLRKRRRAILPGVTRRFGRNKQALDDLQSEARSRLREEIRRFKTQTQRAMARIAANEAHAHNTLFVCGHTHTAEIVTLGDNKTYINTGTWTEIVWNLASGLYEARRFPFLEIEHPNGQAEPVGRLLVWRSPDEPPQPWNEVDGTEGARRILAGDKETVQ